MKKIYFIVFVLIGMISPHASASQHGSYYPTVNEFIGSTFQTSRKFRKDFETEHGIYQVQVGPFSGINPSSNIGAKQILVLPFHFMHLRQTLQFLFLLASEDEITEISGSEEKLDWSLRVAHELSTIYPQAFPRRSSHSSCANLLWAATQGRQALEREITTFSILNPTLSREQIIDEVFHLFTQYYLLKFIREFNPNDRLGYDSRRQTLGILDDGDYELERGGWVNEEMPYVDRVANRDQEYRHLEEIYTMTPYIYSRMTIDFTRVDPRIAIPITPDMNDWQRDWPDSAGIRFFIQGRAYDVYFPVKWSAFHTDLAPENLKLNRDARSYWAFDTSDLPNTHLTPDGIRFFRKESHPGISRASRTRNFAHYPLQTPKIIKAFSKRPLHRIWNIGDSLGIGGSFPARLISDAKDDIYKTLDEALATFDCMPHFEFLWDARSSFFPEAHVSDFSYHSEMDRTDEFHLGRAYHSFSQDVPTEYVSYPAGFLRVLQKVDAVEQPFSWDYFGTNANAIPMRNRRISLFSKEVFFGIAICGAGLAAVGGILGASAGNSEELIEPGREHRNFSPLRVESLGSFEYRSSKRDLDKTDAESLDSSDKTESSDKSVSKINELLESKEPLAKDEPQELKDLN